MDPKFYQQVPVARPRPRKPGQAPTTRESNVLRASVLDAALELGLGTNPIVAGWMFDNPLTEENEDEDSIVSPGLTYTTSEESSNSALSPSSSAHSSGSSSKFTGYGAGAHLKMLEEEPNITVVEPSPMNLSFEQSISGIAFPEIPPPPITSTKKLKKKKKDGYESDGGYISEAAKKKDKSRKVSEAAEAKKRVKEEKKEQELERKRTKSLVKAAKKAEATLTGYDTDGGAISGGKKKASGSIPFPGDGYETEGYQSATPKKSKTRFFKLSTKSSKSEVQNIPPLPTKSTSEFIPLPIADRFATTFGPLTLSGLSEDSAPLLILPTSASSSSGRPPMPTLKSSLAFPSPKVRDSHVSAGSSSSSGSRSQHLHGHLPSSLSPSTGTVESIGSGNAHHGHYNGSISTVTSPQSNILDHPTPSIASATQSSMSGHSSKSGSIESSIGSLRPPAMSFPAIRTPSPSRRPPPVPPPASAPPVAPLKLLKNLRSKASLDNFHLPSMSRARSPSPMPVTPISPSPSSAASSSFAMTAPANSTASSPTLGLSSPLQSMQSMHLQLPSASQGGSPISPVSPRSPGRYFPVDNSPSPTPSSARQPVFPPPRTVISPPNTSMYGQRPTNLTINSGLSPSVSPTSASGLTVPSPNVLAYYDLPPPSPPPAGPLPRVPPQSLAAASSPNGQILPSPAALRQRFIDRTPRQLPPDFSAVINGHTNIERGRQPPFPARPVAATPQAQEYGARAGVSDHVSGPPARLYRDLYSPAGAGNHTTPAGDNGRLVYDEEEEEEEDALANVLDRYEDHSTSRLDDLAPARAEERNFSSSIAGDDQDAGSEDHDGYAARPRPPREREMDVDASRYSEYQFDDGRTIGDRTSRWSGSIYSRASMMDAEESGETRDRFLQRVEAMVRQNGEIPPVPRLPDGYSGGSNSNVGGTPGRSWNRF